MLQHLWSTPAKPGTSQQDSKNVGHGDVLRTPAPALGTGVAVVSPSTLHTKRSATTARRRRRSKRSSTSRRFLNDEAEKIQQTSEQLFYLCTGPEIEIEGGGSCRERTRGKITPGRSGERRATPQGGQEDERRHSTNKSGATTMRSNSKTSAPANKHGEEKGLQKSVRRLANYLFMTPEPTGSSVQKTNKKMRNTNRRSSLRKLLFPDLFDEGEEEFLRLQPPQLTPPKNNTGRSPVAVHEHEFNFVEKLFSASAKKTSTKKTSALRRTPDSESYLARNFPKSAMKTPSAKRSILHEILEEDSGDEDNSAEIIKEVSTNNNSSGDSGCIVEPHAQQQQLQPQHVARVEKERKIPDATASEQLKEWLRRTPTPLRKRSSRNKLKKHPLNRMYDREPVLKTVESFSSNYTTLISDGVPLYKSKNPIILPAKNHVFSAQHDECFMNLLDRPAKNMNAGYLACDHSSASSVCSARLEMNFLDLESGTGEDVEALVASTPAASVVSSPALSLISCSMAGEERPSSWPFYPSSNITFTKNLLLTLFSVVSAAMMALLSVGKEIWTLVLGGGVVKIFSRGASGWSKNSGNVVEGDDFWEVSKWQSGAINISSPSTEERTLLPFSEKPIMAMNKDPCLFVEKTMESDLLLTRNRSTTPTAALERSFCLEDIGAPEEEFCFLI